MEAYTWDNRVRFVVRHMYDTDNNGYLDPNDFDCLALRHTIFEKKGVYDKELHEKNRKIMLDMWTEIAALADFDHDGQVTIDEFKQSVQNVCMGKKFDDFPHTLKHAINCKFQATDINGDGKISLEEYRMDCLGRMAFSEIKEVDDSYNKLLTEADKAAGGIQLPRYQELYAQFIGSAETDLPGAYLFGPLTVYA